MRGLQRRCSRAVWALDLGADGRRFEPGREFWHARMHRGTQSDGVPRTATRTQDPGNAVRRIAAPTAARPGVHRTPSDARRESPRAQKISRQVRTPTRSDGSNLDHGSNRAADQVRRMRRRWRVPRMCSRDNGIGPPLRRRRTDVTSTRGQTSSRQLPIRRTRFCQPPVRPTWRRAPVRSS